MSDINPTISTTSRFKRILVVSYHVAVYALFAYVLTAIISMILRKLSVMDWSLVLPPSGLCLLAWLVTLWFPLPGAEKKDKAAT